MRKLTFAQIPPGTGPLVPGVVDPPRPVAKGGFRRYDEPGFRTHDGDDPHVHPHTHELFWIFQGSGTLEIDGHAADTFAPGEVVVIEPGEDHHLVSTGPVPLVFTWMQLDPLPGAGTEGAAPGLTGTGTA